MSVNAAPIIAAQRMRKERKLVEYLRERGALSAATATPLGAQRGLRQAALRGLLRHGAVLQMAEDSYWLDEAAYEAMRAKRHRRIAVILPLIAAAILILAVIVALVVSNRT